MSNLLGHDKTYFLDMMHYSQKGIKKFGEIYAQNLRKIIEEANKIG